MDERDFNAMNNIIISSHDEFGQFKLPRKRKKKVKKSIVKCLSDGKCDHCSSHL